MEQEVKLTNRNFTEMTVEVKENSADIIALKGDIADLKAAQNEHGERISELEKQHEMSEATLRYIILEVVTETIKPVIEENRSLKEEIAELRLEKYKLAFNVLKWVGVTGGAVGVIYIMNEIIKAVVN
ncbi:hypothetical protein [Paenilisteria rocourtiae]|uniref:Uncharacterized protein n=1 Tax=Listeria rocourtiae TaxID=647910 RepID=A0A4R6ZR21_9LIST|nr:hypothetical protein [Listeria rocourtiae]EUJ44416.1 hypothetical protein PROCOU_13973 [Listeria rocourtiae FSL F6-920]TDR55103.1 hypothetical protein DFP96_10131 [Listeria rocourtiae]